MKKLVTCLLILSLLNQSAMACLWDYDTLAMERQQFPDALELITGKFLRHSEAFYRWRIEDRLKQLESAPRNAILIDDLAVAYDKVGEHQKAIDLMLESKKSNPDRYETAANLGTFYIHAGELQKGVDEIGRAMQINPNAHFGREEYQKLLVEFLLESKSNSEIENKTLYDTKFPKFILQKKFQDVNAHSEEAREEIRNAATGVMGMMRFGNFDSPILLEALGDLLVHFDRPEEAPHRLAARAFLKASLETEDKDEEHRLRLKASMRLKFQTQNPGSQAALSLGELETNFRSELDEAEQWYAQVVADEKRWIAEGKDLDAEFSKKYYEEPAFADAPVASRLPIWVIAILAGLGGVGYFFLRKPAAPKKLPIQ